MIVNHTPGVNFNKPSINSNPKNNVNFKSSVFQIRKFGEYDFTTDVFFRKFKELPECMPDVIHETGNRITMFFHNPEFDHLRARSLMQMFDKAYWGYHTNLEALYPEKFKGFGDFQKFKKISEIMSVDNLKERGAAYLERVQGLIKSLDLFS